MKFIYWLLLCVSMMSQAIAHDADEEPHDTHAEMHISSHVGNRIETSSEKFELVGYLQEDEFSILIDRYDSNEPVLNGQLEAVLDDGKEIKAIATFHADHGDYAITDKRFLNALAEPGKHALHFRLRVANETDFLNSLFEISPIDSHSPEKNSFTKKWMMVVSGVIILVLLMLLVLYRHRYRQRSH